MSLVLLAIFFLLVIAWGFWQRIREKKGGD